eukprot:11164475-Lingulodinium_polyedra.AAC.1
MGLAPPCSTWSRARRPPLRTRAVLQGLPSLAEAKRRRVRAGAELALATVELASACLAEGI